MKKNILLLFLCLSISCQQKPVSKGTKNTVDDLQIPHPLEKIDYNNVIGFACYESGSMTKPVKFFYDLIHNKNYVKVKEKLYSSVPAEKYLATILCEKLENKKSLKITIQEENQIKNNKSSKELVLTCTGCTNSDEVVLSDLLKFEQNYFTEQLEEWLKN